MVCYGVFWSGQFLFKGYSPFVDKKNLNIALKNPKICYRYNKMRFFTR